MTNPIRIHHFPLSGHAHRAALFASLIDLLHELVEVDLKSGAHKQPDFLTLNPNGQVPVLEDGDTVISDSNAILVYLARKYAPDWLPADAIGAARVQAWLTEAAGGQAFGPAAARLITIFGLQRSVDDVQTIAAQYLGRMEAHLEGRDWLVGDRPTIADIANYSYTAHAPEGNVSLSPYPNIRAFLARVEALTRFTPMPRTAIGLAA